MLQVLRPASGSKLEPLSRGPHPRATLRAGEALLRLLESHPPRGRARGLPAGLGAAQG